MPFKEPPKTRQVPNDPEHLYSVLARNPNSSQSLWTHQGDVLRSYFAEHRATADVALELPTGTGKTLPGLLIADWVRQTKRGHVLYACPTQQLAKQVQATADREGIQTALLVGRHSGWPQEQHRHYLRSERVAITTYSSIFNSSPKFEPPELIIFDDAHASEQYVAGAYSLSLRRHEDAELFDGVLETLRNTIDGVHYQQLRSPGASGFSTDRIIMRPIACDNAAAVSLHETLSSSSELDHRFTLSMLHSGLASCMAYVTSTEALVRPLIPPTFENRVFTEAGQRIYLSATLGAGGELERSFGRKDIVRIALPSTSPVPRSGRRFFVFSRLARDVDSQKATRDTIDQVGKALILTPDRRSAEEIAQQFRSDYQHVFDASDIDQSLTHFRSVERGICVLPSRYDGIDLPGEECRLVVLNGLPDGTNLQERFLTSRARAASALAERVRTRVLQGAGRCTRGPNDYAVVLVTGADLTNYMLNPATCSTLDPESQAEVEFGIENSDTELANQLANLRIFVTQADEWRNTAEEHIADLRQRLQKKDPDGSELLARSVPHEIDACTAAWSGAWNDASAALVRAASILGEGGEHTRGYRSFLLFLAGIWAHQSAMQDGQESTSDRAFTLIAQAAEAAQPSQWVREMPIPTKIRRLPSEQMDDLATGKLEDLWRRKNDNWIQARIQQVSRDLNYRDHSVYEPALSELGRLLGARAYKPNGEGRCDAVWVWENACWIAIEAKSEQDESKPVAQRDVRQISDQLRMLAVDLDADAPPARRASLLVSPRSVISAAAQASAETDVYLCSLQMMLDIARDLGHAWQQLYTHRIGQSQSDARDHIRSIYSQFDVLPSQVFERLTQLQINGTT